MKNFGLIIILIFVNICRAQPILPTFQQRVYPGPGKLKCNQVQRHTCNAQAWTTIFDLTDGPQVVTSLWLANNATGKARLCPIRITFDGAGSPQIIGFTDEIFGASFDHTNTFRARFNGVTKNSADQMSGYLRLPMPYQTSCKVEFFNAEASGSCSTWAMIERMPLDFPLNRLGLKSGMHLYTYGYGQDGYVEHYVEKTLLETTEPTILVGLFHYWKNGTGGLHGDNFYYLEGDYRIYYGGEGTASYRSSGSEDFYFSSWYFNEGTFAEDDKIMVAKDAADPYRCCANRFFRPCEAPENSSGIKLTWTNGEEVVGDPKKVYTRWIAWYYK